MGFVDEVRVDDDGVADLDVVFCVADVGCLFGKVELAGAVAGGGETIECVANGEGVAFSELEIDARAGGGVEGGIGHGFVDGGRGIRGIHRDDDGLVLAVGMEEVGEVGGVFVERAVHVCLSEPEIVARLLLDERVGGVPRRLAADGADVAGEFVGAGFGEDFDAAVADAIELRGEGILIDADLADGGFGRELAPAESINIDFAAVGSGRGPGECLKFILQLTGVIGKGVEVVAFDDDCA